MSQDAQNQPTQEEVEVEASTTEQTEAQSLEELQVQVEALTQEVKDTKARANADMYNFQKRVERETDLAKKFAVEKLARDLLDVVDNLERAIAAAQQSGEASSVLDGVELTYKALLTTLERHKISVVNPEGEDFNADLHEAVGVDPQTEAGKVGVVLQKGYTLEGRLLRPAMVQVGA